MPSLTAQDLFKADDLPAGASLEGAELVEAFWQVKKLQRESQQQQAFWKSVNQSMSDAYAKLASFQEELKASREALREANEELERKVEERTLALSEARDLAENVVSSISDMLLLVGVDGVITHGNRAAVALLGIAEGDLVGRPIGDVVSPDPEHALALPGDWLAAVLRDGEIRSVDAACVTASGRAMPVVFSAARLRRPGAGVIGAVCIAKDVTERRQAERELLAQLERIRAQQETIRALFTPVIQVWDRVLVLPLVGAIDRDRVAEIMSDLLGAVSASRSAFVILDLTGVKDVDAATADHLLKIHGAVGLLGARCLLSGLSPLVARAFTSLDVDLGALVSFGTLEAALRQALRDMGASPGRRPPGGGR
jgi:rsbT co-antagonist protein RsbR